MDDFRDEILGPVLAGFMILFITGTVLFLLEKERTADEVALPALETRSTTTVKSVDRSPTGTTKETFFRKVEE